MSSRAWGARMLLFMALIGWSGCGSSNQPQGTAPPAPTAEEKAKLKADPSEKVGQPISGKTGKRR